MSYIQYLLQDRDADKAVHFFGQKLGTKIEVFGAGGGKFHASLDNRAFMTTLGEIFNREYSIYHGQWAEAGETPDQAVSEMRQAFLRTASTNQFLAIETGKENATTHYRLLRSDGGEGIVDFGTLTTRRDQGAEFVTHFQPHQ